MTSALQSPKMLIVDTSPSMAQVLSTYADLENIPTETICDPARACVALDMAAGLSAGRYQSVVLGWPEGKINIIADILAKLSEDKHLQLPLIIVSQEGHRVIQTLSKRRPNTRSLRWKDYRQLARLNGDLVPYQPIQSVPNQYGPNLGESRHHNAVKSTRRVLLIADPISESREIVDLLKDSACQVTVQSTVNAAKEALRCKTFDLVISDYYLENDRCEALCKHLNEMERPPVYALMTSENLDTVVQKSLSLGAITCLNKAEPTNNLKARLDTILKGLPRRQPVSIAADATEQVHLAVAGMLEILDAPALLLNAQQQIVAANKKAIKLLAPNDERALLDAKSVDTVFKAGLNEVQHPSGHAQFSTLAGDVYQVGYQIKELEGASIGINGDHKILTFNTLSKKATVKAPVVDRELSVSSDSAPQIPAKVRMPVKSGLIGLQNLEQRLNQLTDNADKNLVIAMLMLDVKMIAAVTGDRLSVGHSEPMLEMVKENLGDTSSDKNALAYIGSGRFAMLVTAQRVEQALSHSKKLVDSVPNLISNLVDVELVSHASFLRVPDHSSMSLKDLLTHCVAGCLKTEENHRDNEIYVIGKELWQADVSSATGAVAEHEVNSKNRRPVNTPVENPAIEAALL